MSASTIHKRIGEIKSKLFTILWYKRMFYQMGSHSSIHPPFFTRNPQYMELGHHVSIGPYCRIEVHPAPVRSKAPKPFLQIGNRVRLEHGVNVSCHQSLIIEDEVLIAGGCYIGDNNHSMDPEGPRYLLQPLSGSPVVIERGVWLGQNVCVLAGSRIGERSIIGAGSVVNGHIPPFSIAVGSPAKVVKQYCFETKEWKKVNHSSEPSSSWSSSSQCLMAE